MDDPRLQPEAPCPAHQVPDAVPRSPGVQVFQDAIQVRQWDAGASDASVDEHRPDLWPDETRTARLFHSVLADVDAQKSVCRAACRPRSAPLPPGLCRWGEDLSEA